MADARFFHNAGPFRLSDLASLTGATLATASGATPDGNLLLHDVAPLERATGQELSFLDNTKYLAQFGESKAGACFVLPKYVSRAPKGMALLVSDHPYYAHAVAAQHFYPAPKPAPGISPQAHIAASAQIGAQAHVGPGAVIGERAVIGANCVIGANSVIGDGVEIGDNSVIGALCSVTHAIVGKHVIMHRGVHIGQDGFGFAASPRGILKVPQLGRVVIGDHVEIGSGTCIDRGAGPDTVIGAFTKIDNLVQIGHNVQIGKYVIIVSQCGISGSTQIGDGAQLGGQSGYAGHLKVGAGAKLAAKAGVMSDIPAGATYGGFPAMPIRDWHRQSVTLNQLIKKKDTSHG